MDIRKAEVGNSERHNGVIIKKQRHLSHNARLVSQDRGEVKHIKRDVSMPERKVGEEYKAAKSSNVPKIAGSQSGVPIKRAPNFRLPTINEKTA